MHQQDVKEALGIIVEELIIQGNKQLIVKFLDLINILRTDVLVNFLNTTQIEEQLWSVIRKDKSLFNLVMLLTSSFKFNCSVEIPDLATYVADSLINLKTIQVEDVDNVSDTSVINLFGDATEYSLILSNEHWLLVLTLLAINMRLLLTPILEAFNDVVPES